MQWHSVPLICILTDTEEEFKRIMGEIPFEVDGRRRTEGRWEVECRREGKAEGGEREKGQVF